MIKTLLYKGTIELCFEEARHRFTVNNKPVLSVTAATSVVDKSRPLIYWATGLSRDFLMENLKKLIADTKGDKIAALIEEAVKQHQIKKEKAANAGTQIHAWVSQFIKAKTEKDWPVIPKDPQIYNGINAFLKWVDEYKVKFLSSEKFIYSKKYKYAGIMDADGIIARRTCPIDFKAANGMYSENRFQLAGYQGAVEEESGKLYSGNKWLVRFGKDDGEFEAHEYAEHDRDYKAFLAALTLRRRLKELDKFYRK